MFAMVQNKEMFCEIFFDHFKENKVEIATAITKLFPFLDGLRDRSFITEKIYADSQEASRNLVPIARVVYHVLGHLEKVFDWSLLQTLFSKVNLKEYPGLVKIYKSFENVLQDKYFSQRSDLEGRQQTSITQPSHEQACHLGAILSGTRTRTSEPVWDVNSKRIKTEHSIYSPDKALGTQQEKYDCAQAVAGESSALPVKREEGLEEEPSPLLRGGQGAKRCRYENLVPTSPVCLEDQQKARPVQNQVNEIIVISSEDSQSSGEEQPQVSPAWHQGARLRRVKRARTSSQGFGILELLLADARHSGGTTSQDPVSPESPFFPFSLAGPFGNQGRRGGTP